MSTPDSALVGIDHRALAGVRRRLDAFRAGSLPLTGLALYHLLEACTPLLRFHAMLRSGPQNRLRSGLQQSYGDHNRLLLLGIDRLVAGDVGWYRSRLADPADVRPAELARCAAGVGALGLGRHELACLWVAAALHDCGKLSGRAARLDVEDGLARWAPILDALCDEPHATLGRFVIRNHDYIKDVFDGAVPAAFIARQVEALPVELRGLALAALGIVQVAGAASLGEGRLSGARLGICRRCFEGRPLEETSADARLARLVGDAHLEVGEPARQRAAAGMRRLAPGARERLAALLDRALLHGWSAAREALVGATAGSRATESAPTGRSGEPLLPLLARVADRWSADGTAHEHVVLGEGLIASLARAPAPDTWRIGARRLRLDTGVSALVLDA